MKVTQKNYHSFIVVLNDAELRDIKDEAEYSKVSLLNVMKAIFLMTFVQFTSCRYFRRQLRL